MNPEYVCTVCSTLPHIPAVHRHIRPGRRHQSTHCGLGFADAAGSQPRRTKSPQYIPSNEIRIAMTSSVSFSHCCRKIHVFRLRHTISTKAIIKFISAIHSPPSNILYDFYQTMMKAAEWLRPVLCHLSGVVHRATHTDVVHTLAVLQLTRYLRACGRDGGSGSESRVCFLCCSRQYASHRQSSVPSQC